MSVLKSVRLGYLVGPTIFCFCEGAPKDIVLGVQSGSTIESCEI